MPIIVCGYPGVGKSSLAHYKNNCVDLESSNFYLDDDTRDEHWYVGYVNTAIDIRSQGFDVFMSCHECVRRRLEDKIMFMDNMLRDDMVLVVAPSIDIKKEWRDRLYDRFLITHDPKDYKAYEHADHLEDDLEDICNGGLPVMLVKNLDDYHLEDLLLKYTQSPKWARKDGVTCL